MNNITELEQQLVQENQAMARYALASGKRIAGDLAQRLNDLLVSPDAAAESASADENEATPGRKSVAPSAQMIKQLSGIHAHLSQLVAPAKPGAILYLQQQTAKAGVFGFLGPVKLTRRMMLMASISMVVLILTSMSPLVTPEILSGPVLALSGYEQVMVITYLMSAAGLGAAFAALFLANRYITAGTFDPTFEPTYWTRLALGVIAGLIISAMVPLGAPEPESTMTHYLAKPTLALLGGFSAGAVYRILERLVDAVESVFQGDARAVVSAREQLMNTRLEGQLTQVRIETAARLMTLQRSLPEGQSGEELEQHLAGILQDLLPTGLEGPDSRGDDLPQSEAIPGTPPTPGSR